MAKFTRRDFSKTLAASGGIGWLTQLGRAIAPPGAGPAAGAGGLTDVPGIRVGHWTDTRRPTGCTAILFDPEATAAVDWDGSAPGEQMAVMLQPASSVQTIHGMLLTGGGVQVWPPSPEPFITWKTATWALNGERRTSYDYTHCGRSSNLRCGPGMGKSGPILRLPIRRVKRRPPGPLRRGTSGQGRERRWKRCSPVGTA